MGDDIRADWERRQRAALLPYDHPTGGSRSRAEGPLRVFRWLLIAVVIGLALAALAELLAIV